MNLIALILALAALVIGAVAFYRMASYATPPVREMGFMLVFLVLVAFFAGSLAERVLL